MNKEEILASPKGKATAKYIRCNHPEEYDIVLTFPGESFAEKLYNYFYDNPQHICPTCGKPTKFRSITTGYSEFCSVKCSYCSESRLKKIQETTLKKYGVKNASQSDEIKNKKRETCIKNYGVTSGLKLKEKCEKTILERYGVKNASQSEEIKKKKQETWRKNFLNKHELHIGFDEQGNWICSCPHKHCDKCLEKTFTIPQQTFNDRRRNQTEICTKLLPVGCANQGTTLELFVRELLDRNGVEYLTNYRELISPKELDIFIPSLNLAIECNGLYWHSRKELSYHIDKFVKCRDKGVRLITIWEDWFKRKPEVVESVLLSKLGLSSDKIFARNCVVKEVSSKDCSKFLDTNHIQGKSNSSIKLGLYYNDELVSVMTFSKSRHAIGRKEDSFELVRFCNKLNTTVVGGASKLLKYFVKMYSPNKIVSYSSNDISDGGLYQTLGFTSNNHINPCYWYVHQATMERFHRLAFCKARLKEMGYDTTQTESTIMSNLPYFKINDSGTIRWELKIVG